MQALKNFLKSFHFLVITFFVCLTLLFFTYLPEPGGDANPRSAKASIPPTLTAALSARTPEVQGNPGRKSYVEIKSTIQTGDTLASSFAAQDIPGEIRDRFFLAFKEYLDFNNIHPGDRYSITLDQEGRIIKARYHVNRFTSFTAIPTADGLRVSRDEVQLEVRTKLLKGTITTSLFAAFPDDLQSPKPIYAFADIFAAKLDFNTETREGDNFSLIIEEYYRSDKFLGYGPISAARYEKSNGEILQAFRFSPDGKVFNYYDAEGHELGASFIRSPVAVARVSSRFSRHRLHPILGVVKEHLGVDLAAPTGTPIMAAADGRVVTIGNNGGFGKQIVLAHGGDYRTYYGHLSKFKRGIKVGSQVKQKQIIGYVGSTGLATGPHLDYRLQHHGIYKNPFALKFQPKSTLAGADLQALSQVVAGLDNSLRTGTADELIAARSITLGDDRQPTLL